MPVIHNYIVEETRRVKVWANSPIEAARVANVAFMGNDPEAKHALLKDGVMGNPEGDVIITNLTISEEF